MTFHSRWYYSSGLVLLALLYWAAGKAGLFLTAAPLSHAAAMWPAAGIALSAMLLFGYRFWPGIVFGALLLNVDPVLDISSVASGFKSFVLAISIGSGATVQAVTGAFLIRRYVGLPNPLTQKSEILKFLGLGGPLSCLISCTWGVTSLTLGGAITPTDYLFTWWTWWVGDTIGVLIVTPLVLVALGQPRPIWCRRRLSVGLLLAIAFAAVVAVFVYASNQDKEAHPAGV